MNFSATETSGTDADLSTDDEAATAVSTALVRYGVVPQVARFAVTETVWSGYQDQLVRGCEVVVETDRGTELGTLLQLKPQAAEGEAAFTGTLLRTADSADHQNHRDRRRQAVDEFFVWQERIQNWKLQLQLIDLEMTLDGQYLVLYVLNSQDAETTRLALLVAAAGLGIVHVQPVNADGVSHQASGGGCGSGGCGSGGCGH